MHVVKGLDIAKKVVSWCKDQLGLCDIDDLVIDIRIEDLGDCWGYCEQELDTNNFVVAVDPTQSLRDFVMTVVHEMVHVKQYVNNKWWGDGEEEAWALQELLTDRLWKEDIL